eukprot:8899826-Pyramimonas_sp.AAC.1
MGRFRLPRGRRGRHPCGSRSVEFGPRPFSLRGGLRKGGLSTADIDVSLPLGSPMDPFRHMHSHA